MQSKYYQLLFFLYAMGVYFGYLYNCYFGYCNSDGTNTPKKTNPKSLQKS